MDRNTLLNEIQSNTNEIKGIVDVLCKDGEISFASLGNLSFLTVLLQEQVETFIRNAR